MKKTQKRLLVTLCVIVGIVAVLSVAVRLILTREALMELVLPRLERAVRAEITVSDIGVRFPFGFGVDIKGLSFEKTLPQGEVVGFEGETIVELPPDSQICFEGPRTEGPGYDARELIQWVEVVRKGDVCFAEEGSRLSQRFVMLDFLKTLELDDALCPAAE